MNSRISIFLAFLAFSLLGSQFCFAQANELKNGAVIVVGLEGPVRFLDSSGNPLSQKISIGSTLEVGQFAQSGANGKLVLLLSNGTLLSLKERTKMQVGEFEQEPFDPNGRKVSDLEEEPSSSSVELNLDWGSMVVKTKKLRRGSTLNIHSETGTAGIRGTEFQISQNPGQGLQLDVTESTVSFTPPGGQSIPVSQGQGLDVSQNGAVAQRPVNPVVAQSIVTTNEAATQASEEVSLGVVADAMMESSTPLPETDLPTTDGEESEKLPQEALESLDDDKPDVDLPDEETGSQEVSEPLAMSAPLEVKIDEVLEQNQDLKQVRKSGKVGISASKISKFNLDEDELSKFQEFSQHIQDHLSRENALVVERLMELKGFGVEEAEMLFSYSPKARRLVLLLENKPMLSLLQQTLDESLILDTLTPNNIEQASSSNLPTREQTNAIDDRVLSLANRLRESGKEDLYEEIMEEVNFGLWSGDTLRLLEVSDILTSEYNLPGNLDEVRALSGREALANPFYLQVASLYDVLLEDGMDVGTNPQVIGAKSISFGEGRMDSSQFAGSNGLLIGASESLSLGGSINLDGSAGNRMVLMSGEAIKIEKGTSLKTMLSDLVLSAREDVLLDGVEMESVREIALHSLRNLDLQNVRLNADSMVRMKASRDLNVDGLELSRNLPSLIMEATTIRLRNVDFPSSTAVQLNSLKGPLDGKYPTFGTGVPRSEQLGRVNFLENVRSGGNPLKDRPSFDQFGKNITIGKVPLP